MLVLIKSVLMIAVVNLFSFQSLQAAQKEKIMREVSVQLKGPTGNDLGSGKITEMAKGVKLSLELKGLPAGEHALHFHENGKCQGPDFKSAGGHFSPSKKEHGLENTKGSHEGDMKNFVVSADGTAKVEVQNQSVTLGKGENSLLKEGGTALVIHAKADDYKSQPAGNAGDRIGCAEIKP